jgi:hypothetical protein
MCKPAFWPRGPVGGRFVAADRRQGAGYAPAGSGVPRAASREVSVRRILTVLAVLTLFATSAACGGDDASDDGDSAASSADSNGDIEDMDEDGGFDIDVEEEEEADLVNEDVIDVVQQFWYERAEDIGVDFQPIPDDRISPVPTDDGSPAPVCGGEPIPPEAVEQNAFAATCPEGLTVAWDPALIDERLTELYGEAGPAVVFAHEFGHVIQYQSGILDITGQGIGDPSSVIIENQADCFAGAWVAQQVEDEFGPFHDGAALDSSLGALIEVRDPAGSDPNDPLAHGNGFDRVRAFQDGIDRGIEYCYGYIDDPPHITELPFTEADLENQGNLEFDEVSELVIEDLDDFFGDNVDDFEGPGDPLDYVPEDDLRELHGEIGDGAVATIFGMLWSQRAQEAAGDEQDGQGALLQRACLVGAWLGDILDDQADGQADRPSGVSLSPGDLDETIITFLKLTEQAQTGGGVAFESISAMRLGVFGSIDDCRLGEF